MKRFSVDGEVVSFSLPKDYRIRIKSAEELIGLARKLSRPLLHGVFSGYTHPSVTRFDRKGFHVLFVCDGPWVYYCEIQEGSSAKEDVRPQ